LSETDEPVDAEIDATVAEIVEEASGDLASLDPAQKEYLREHALRRPMGTAQVWAMGVGVVITGEYFGWNGGLAEAGPIGMLIASLFVCALYMAWVLALSELSVAMPFAGGPLAYGRRAIGPGFGFLMGWSMFLECLFATIGTAIATGGYFYFILDILFEGLPRLATATIAGLITVAVFAVVQWVGAKQQARLMEWMTYGAILGLVWFWIAAAPGVRVERLFTRPILTNGWVGVLKAIPYAIWWLVMIESVALAAEEAHEPRRSIPRGLTLAQLTLIVLVILTWFFVATAGSSFKESGDPANLFPLPWVYREVWPGRANLPHLVAFCLVAICGMVASYNGMIYAVSRQSFALGRAGYLPKQLGHLNPTRRTPTVSIAVWSLVVAGFVVWGYFDEQAVQYAVLTCNLAALIWYALAMVCLFVLRAKEPGMIRPYRVPWYPFLPAFVLVASIASMLVYGALQKPVVLGLTAFLYALGLGYYFLFARGRLEDAAPEEIAARAGREALDPA
jgi:ethanolamine permease